MDENRGISGQQDDLDYFAEKIHEKVQVYNDSPLTAFHDHLLKIFFDLAQQYDGLDSFYHICVAIPQALHRDITTSLAVLTPGENKFQLALSSVIDTHVPQQLINELSIHPSSASYIKGDFLIFPVISRPLIAPKTKNQFLEYNTSGCQGALCISDFERLSDIDRIFLEKLVTRMGYNLQRRLMQANNLNHVNFLKRLGRDIGHNVITPNMHFKNLFRKLQRKINLIDDEVQTTLPLADGTSKKIIYRCNEIREELILCHDELLGHYNRTSLYLETLLREEHFSRGEFVLKLRRCQIEDDIIIPELEIYRKRFIQQGIFIDQPQNMQGRHFILKGDLGLLSQVFDNLFSNAVKYTVETPDSHGDLRKAMAYGCKDIDDFPEKRKRGVKFNIFSTGGHLTEQERLTIFNDGVRGQNVGSSPGSGHGLAFVRNVVEIHGGTVGYEAVPGGNNFYFILPLPKEEEE